MTKNQKTFAYIGGGILLLLLLFRKRGAQKSLEEGGAPSEEGGIGGGGGGGFSPVSILPVSTPPAVIVNNTPYTPQSGVPTYNAGQFTNVPQTPSGAPAPITTASITTSRDTSTPTPPPSALPTRPPVSAISKFTDFDGDANFQDALL